MWNVIGLYFGNTFFKKFLYSWKCFCESRIWASSTRCGTESGTPDYAR